MSKDLRDLYAGFCLGSIMGASHGRFHTHLDDVVRKSADAAEALVRELERRDDDEAAARQATLHRAAPSASNFWPPFDATCSNGHALIGFHGEQCPLCPPAAAASADSGEAVDTTPAPASDPEPATV